MEPCQYCRNVATSVDRTGPICLDCEDSALFNEKGSASPGDHLIVGEEDDAVDIIHTLRMFLA